MDKVAVKRIQYTYNGELIYEWEQTLEDLHIYIKTPSDTTAKAITCNIQPTSITIRLLKNKDTPFLHENFEMRINSAESMWYNERPQPDDTPILKIQPQLFTQDTPPQPHSQVHGGQRDQPDPHKRFKGGRMAGCFQRPHQGTCVTRIYVISSRTLTTTKEPMHIARISCADSGQSANTHSHTHTLPQEARCTNRYT